MSQPQNTLLLDQVRWDTVLDSSGNIALATPPYSVAQDVSSAVKLFLGELWWQIGKGVPYWGQILGKMPSRQFMRTKFVAAAMTVPGVVSAKCYFSSFLEREITGQIQIVDANGVKSVAGFGTANFFQATQLPKISLSLEYEENGEQMISRQFSFFEANQGGSDNEGDFIISKDFMVRNNEQANVSGRGGYTPNTSCTSESQFLLMRGFIRAYIATGVDIYLIWAKFIFNAAVATLFDGQAPTYGEAWNHNWIANAGAPFAVKGPFGEVPAMNGEIGASVSFTDGIAYLPTPPSDVYQIFNGTLIWQNVFSALYSGTSYSIQYFIDALGNKVEGFTGGTTLNNNPVIVPPATPPFSADQIVIDDGGDYSVAPSAVFSAPPAGGTTATGTVVMTGTAITGVTLTNGGGSGYAAGSPPTVAFTGGTGSGGAAHAILNAGKILLTDTGFSGTLLVNYAIYEDDNTVAHGQAFECWPMWRYLVENESNAAADAIGWLINCMELFAQAEPGNPTWALALSLALQEWTSANTFITTADVFFQQEGVPYNFFPLTYCFGAFTDGSPFGDPSTYFSYGRTATGYCQFTLPSDTDRSNFIFQNGGCYITFNSGCSVSADVQVSVGSPMAFSFQDTSGNNWTNIQTLTEGNTTPLSIPISAFLEQGTSGIWFPSNPYYSGNTTISGAMQPYARGGQIFGLEATLADTTSYFGFSSVEVPGGMDTNTPPIIAYATTSTDLQYRVQDADGWYWVANLAAQATVTETTILWSSFSISYYQTNIGTPPSTPNETGNIQQFEIINTVGTAQTIYVAYVAIASPAQASSGQISQFSIICFNQGEITLDIGTVSIVGGTRVPIQYSPGANVFNYPVNSAGAYAGGGHASEAPYQGPFYAGYNNPNPWIILGNQTAIQNSLQFFIDSQTAYQVSTAVSGPFCPVFYPPTWDGSQSGPIGTFGWGGPDPNTVWGGFQYRAFVNAAEAWYRLVQAGSPMAALARNVCSAFVQWVNFWLTINPTAMGLPTLFPEGQAPQPTYVDSGFTANVLKGFIFCQLAGYSSSVTLPVIERLFSMLQNNQVSSGIMNGSWSLDPSTQEDYGFMEGEILDSIALLIDNVQVLFPG